jgi:hypothetical protein
MKTQPNKTWIKILSIIGILVSSALIIQEIQTPCYCPPYPLIGIPACFLVLAFFSLILSSQYIKGQNLSLGLFWGGTIIGFLTAIWFSTNQLLGFAKCPQWFSIPLCFVAFLTFATFGILGLKKK